MTFFPGKFLSPGTAPFPFQVFFIKEKSCEFASTNLDQ